LVVTDRLSSQVHLILPAGTQVVTRVEIRDAAGQLLARRGAVGEIVKAPDESSHGIHHLVCRRAILHNVSNASDD
jgi:hypothetical protein